MELWLLILLSLSSCTVLLLLLLHLATAGGGKKRRLPPGPPAVPILGNLLWLQHSVQNLEPLLREMHARYGPIITLRIGSIPAIFIADRGLAHKALVEHGATFSDRPAPLPATSFLGSNQHNITGAAYGPLWRLLRRNLTSEILHPSRVKLYGGGRQWVLGVLEKDLRSRAGSGDGAVVAMESFQFAMFCLLVLMCFGEKLHEDAIREIEVAQRNLLVFDAKLTVFAFVPRLSKYVFQKRLRTAVEMRRRQRELFVPLIRAREEHKRSQQQNEERFVYSYVDSLLDIQLPDEGGRKLTDDEMVTICSEFLDAGTDTTSTALQWTMANLVTHQEIQRKLAEEIDGVVETEAEEVKEEDLQKMPYLKAVILEGLRRHPPAHFVVPHAVSEEITLEGYVIPKNAVINFMVTEMNWDRKVWEEPMEFRPERFLTVGKGDEIDITGSREIKMMSFGVGRRICPALGLAMLHLKYFVANLVREFEWKGVEGEEVDMSETAEFTVVMKNPLRAHIFPRKKESN